MPCMMERGMSFYAGVFLKLHSTMFGMTNQNQFNEAVCNYGASTNNPTSMATSTGCTGYDVSGNIVGAGNSVAVYMLPAALTTVSKPVLLNTGGYRY